MDRLATISSMGVPIKMMLSRRQAGKNIVCALAAAGLLDHH